MSLKSKAGTLLSRNGHLCSSCCPGVCGENCLNFQTLFPAVSPESAPNYAPRGYTCSGFSKETTASTTYILVAQNPLSGLGKLVVTIEAWFDDDLEIDGVSLGGACSTPIIIPVGTVLTIQPSGGNVTLTVVDNYGVYSGGRGCACWQPVTLESSSPIASLAKVRFDVCKFCSDALQEGFGCRLFRGCCFGRSRTDPLFHCPTGKW